MSDFLKKERERIESRPMGAVKRTYNYSEGRCHDGQRRMQADKQPANVTVEAFPVGRTSGVCKPGDEAKGERYTEPDYMASPFPAVAVSTARKRKK